MHASASVPDCGASEHANEEKDQERTGHDRDNGRIHEIVSDGLLDVVTGRLPVRLLTESKNGRNGH
jgi:hypothetical protein